MSSQREAVLLTFGAAAATIVVAVAIVAGPSILDCARAPHGIAACMGDRLEEAGYRKSFLAPEPGAQPAPMDARPEQPALLPEMIAVEQDLADPPAPEAEADLSALEPVVAVGAPPLLSVEAPAAALPVLPAGEAVPIVVGDIADTPTDVAVVLPAAAAVAYLAAPLPAVVEAAEAPDIVVEEPAGSVARIDLALPAANAVSLPDIAVRPIEAPDGRPAIELAAAPEAGEPAMSIVLSEASELALAVPVLPGLILPLVTPLAELPVEVSSAAEGNIDLPAVEAVELVLPTLPLVDVPHGEPATPVVTTETAPEVPPLVLPQAPLVLPLLPDAPIVPTQPVLDPEPRRIVVAAIPDDLEPVLPTRSLVVPIAPSLDAIEVDRGTVLFAGDGTDGKLVRLYLDGVLNGESPVDGGRWLVESDTADGGRRALTLELIEPATGNVISTAEAEIVIDPPVLPEVLTEPIASDAEPVADVALLPQPKAIELVAPETVETPRRPAALPSLPTADITPSLGSPSFAVLPRPEGIAPERRETVIVRRGDTLWRIADRVYGRGEHYLAIFGANRELLRSPRRIYPGQVLLLPELP